ncbi:uncharacterized protein G2W53_030097 [Senna tora]|uniref:Uncharacterized protein n=1 Tax=Senna tora TaxID=362788 RepID=A0A834T4V1_9FABA|nr:uncharacterized protein G2W53_030097 [Senna tora]
MAGRANMGERVKELKDEVKEGCELVEGENEDRDCPAKKQELVCETEDDDLEDLEEQVLKAWKIWLRELRSSFENIERDEELMGKDRELAFFIAEAKAKLADLCTQINIDLDKDEDEPPHSSNSQP